MEYCLNTLIYLKSTYTTLRDANGTFHCHLIRFNYSNTITITSKIVILNNNNNKTVQFI